MKRTSYQAGSVSLSPRKLGPDVWIFRYSEDGRQKSEIIGTVEQYLTKAAAQKKALKRISEINDRKAGVLVSGLCDRFNRELSEVRSKTAKTYEGFVKRIREDLGHMRVDNLTPVLMEQWVNDLSKLKGGPLSKKSKLHYKAILHLLLEFAMKQEIISWQRNPVTLVKVKGKAIRVRQTTLLTGKQYQDLIDDPDLVPHVRTMIQVAMLLGIRISEVLGLKWDAIDFEAKTVSIRVSVVGKNADDTKTLASQDELPMHDDLAEVLESWKKEGLEVKGWVFGNPKTERPYWGGTMQQDHLVPAGKKVGIKALGWHDFRHTYRAMMGDLDVPLEMQQKLMRHADISMTLKYGKKSDVEKTREFNEKVVELIRRRA